MELKVLLWFLWLCSAPGLSLVVNKWLWYKHRPRTWKEAQELCRSEFGDLATVETSHDRYTLNDMSLVQFHAWIGLKKMDSGWRWWNGYEKHNVGAVFAEGQLEKGHECGKIIRYERKAFTDDCDQKLFFFCRRSLTKYFYAEAKPWAEALEFCMNHSQKLMDMHWTSSDLNYLGSPIYIRPQFPVWIGLHHDGAAWNWSDGTLSQRWNSPPNSVPGSGSCASVTSNSKIIEANDCSKAFPFVCHRHDLVLVPKLVSWEEGLEVCKKITSFDHRNLRMLSVDESDRQDVLRYTKVATIDKAWVGLRFLAGLWFWSDGASVSMPSFTSCPVPKSHCGALDLNTGSIDTVDCNKSLHVLCY